MIGQESIGDEQKGAGKEKVSVLGSETPGLAVPVWALAVWAVCEIACALTRRTVWPAWRGRHSVPMVRVT